ncbi:hypothetical protein Achl_4329 (plasmid) [Pseudarthrobacter chlorophenolicus A6]|uniref:Uncharacterized protein n=1 Tax=Pseudarthrobacter chlorophenolicus (strain ATCC 700700 / DSM 12829 / CIP 107037 / JCM 12360 / KCTC 9906 / NCIMB 13794 / A6) TaxID=452863 RepID=B8HIN3_PSECP|nr:hypothetical protein [Pseudarthrobacter chlorophenolicus]ACL42280.1 hypothetical protein Achl_4329 [Pseudarthrobacter chlorophenolicus A6]
METSTDLHSALRAAIHAPGVVTKSQLVALLKRFPEPEAPAENDLVIRNGILSVDRRECTCAASAWDAPEGCTHEHHCGLEPLLDISLALERSGYRA